MTDDMIQTVDGQRWALSEVSMMGVDLHGTPYLIAKRSTERRSIDLRAWAKQRGLPWLYQLPDQQDDQQRARIMADMMMVWRQDGLRQMAQRDQMTELDAWLEGGGL